MAKQEIMYIELKSGYNDNGPAWIGRVTYSKTKQTIYFNGKAFQKWRGGCSNYYDVDTKDDYWISGVKKNGQDRHWAGSGKIMIDRNVVEDYLKITGEERLDSRRLSPIDISPNEKNT